MPQQCDAMWAVITTSQMRNLKLRVVTELRSFHGMNSSEGAIKYSYLSKIYFYSIINSFMVSFFPCTSLLTIFVCFKEQKCGGSSKFQSGAWLRHCRLSHRNCVKIINTYLKFQVTPASLLHFIGTAFCLLWSFTVFLFLLKGYKKCSSSLYFSTKN